MKVAVAAATGQLGSAIVAQLLPILGPENIIGTSRKPQGGHISGIGLLPGDYDRPEDLKEAFRGIDVVLLISGMAPAEDRIRQHRNVIRAAKQAGVRRLVFTSILPKSGSSTFEPIIQSNRQTEQDIIGSGLDYAIGRNGIYLQPDLEYIDRYANKGKIRNCAGNGRCAYTTRDELGYAYVRLITDPSKHGKIYNLFGELITQAQLAEDINKVYGTNLTYEPVSVREYQTERKAELGEFMGTLVAGIYEGIKNGDHEVTSDFEEVGGRPHHSLITCMEELKLAVV